MSAVALDLSPTGGASCPTSWPEWAVMEDGEIVWTSREQTEGEGTHDPLAEH